MFVPHQFVSLDESLYKFRGRSGLRVYMKDKPGKYGMKAFQVNDPATGFALHVLPYAAKRTVPDDTKFTQTDSSTYNVVRYLVEVCHLAEGSILVIDRYYTGLQLAWDLLTEEKIYMVGTAMNKVRIYGAKDILPELRKTMERGTMAMNDSTPQGHEGAMCGSLGRSDCRHVCKYYISWPG